jgi:hypothetical protein
MFPVHVATYTWNMANPPDYRIVFTDLAKAFARRNGSLQALEECVRGEVNELMFGEDVADDEFTIGASSSTPSRWRMGRNTSAARGRKAARRCSLWTRVRARA